MTTNGQHPPVVTLASLYGAGGSVVGPRVAERLGVPLPPCPVSARQPPWNVQEVLSKRSTCSNRLSSVV